MCPGHYAARTFLLSDLTIIAPFYEKERGKSIIFPMRISLSGAAGKYDHLFVLRNEGISRFF
jgi:hypothetical protein